MNAVCHSLFYIAAAPVAGTTANDTIACTQPNILLPAEISITNKTGQDKTDISNINNQI